MRAKEIRELVKIVEESNIGELEITRWWGRKIRISKASTVRSAGQPPDVVVTSGYPDEKKAVEPESIAAVDDGTGTEPSGDQVMIKAPMVGTFYRSPAPDSEPYVKEGDIISPGTVLCIIEAMKLMNEIEAEISGRIVKILCDNAQPVEYNQPLFLIEPSR